MHDYIKIKNIGIHFSFIIFSIIIFINMHCFV